VLENLESLVIKPAFRVRGAVATRYGALLSARERDALRANIEARPGEYCGQERLLLGTTPAWCSGALQPVPFVMRLFVAWHDGDYRVMPGGLTRFDPSGADAIVSLQRGSATKDIWVLSSGPTEDPPPPPAETTAALHSPESTPSRLADNLYWFGRYLERTAHTLRLLEQVDPILRDEVSTLDPTVARDFLSALLVRLMDSVDKDASNAELAEFIRIEACNAEHAGSLASNLAQLIRVLEQIKVNLPPEFWRILRRLRSIASQDRLLADTDLGQQLSSLEALGNETLAHDTGWHFLNIGRRVERARHLVFLADELLLPDRPNGEPVAAPSEFRLQTMLHFTDTLFIYRSIYHSIYQPASILAWLVCAPENPRGLRFQAERIAEHVAALPEDLAPRAVSALRATAFRLVSSTKLVDPSALAGNARHAQEFFTGSESILTEFNDRLTQIYFSHSDVPETMRGA
jgi:uncharacterized alpha-E superfamily protein